MTRMTCSIVFALASTFAFCEDADAQVTPVFECWRESSDGLLTAVFGYTNLGEPVTIEVGDDNFVTPSPAAHGQPTVFASGTVNAAFTITLPVIDEGAVTWQLDGSVAEVLLVPEMACTACLCPAGSEGVGGGVGPVGADGPTGDAGAQGVPGPAGVTGPTGPIGPRGATGGAGPVGPSGERGVAGAIGPPGAAGPDGAPGPEGASGPDGPRGPQGPQRPTGAADPDGAAGSTGAAGVAGIQGPEGARGTVGQVGERGVEGPAGITGLAGATGTLRQREKLPASRRRDGRPALVAQKPKPRAELQSQTMLLTEETRQRIAAISRRHGASSVRLFGSYARGQASEASDLDLLVEMEEGRSLLDLIDLQDALERELGIDVDVLTPGSLSPYLREAVEKDSVAL